jgi:hypothetical protein
MAQQDVPLVLNSNSIMSFSDECKANMIDHLSVKYLANRRFNSRTWEQMFAEGAFSTRR